MPELCNGARQMETSSVGAGCEPSLGGSTRLGAVAESNIINWSQYGDEGPVEANYKEAF